MHLFQNNIFLTVDKVLRGTRVSRRTLLLYFNRILYFTCFKKSYGQLTPMYTFIVTNLDMKPYQTIQFYYNRSKMENFIKESKSRIDFATVSNNSKIVNSNHMRFHIFVYNLFNWFRRLVLPANMRKQQVDTIRLKLIKIAARAVRSARYITFKLCSSCPYKEEFYRTLKNIQQLTVQLE